MQDRYSKATTTILAGPDIARQRSLPWQAWCSIAYSVLFAIYTATFVVGLGFFPFQIVFGDAGPLVFALATLAMPFVGVWGGWKCKSAMAKVICAVGILLSMVSIVFVYGLFIFLESPQH